MPNQQVRETAIRVIRNLRSCITGTITGNDVTSFEVLEKHDRLEATAESLVEVRPGGYEPFPSTSWEEAREFISDQSDAASIEASEFIYSSPYVPAVPQLVEYARKIFAPRRPLIEAAQDLTHRIHADFKYHPKSTSIDIPLTDVLRNRRGVCQDFAHVMIGVLRSVRLAARYVSGTYVPSENSRRSGVARLISVFVPGCGWVGFDPTNDVISPTATSRWLGAGIMATSLRSKASLSAARAKMCKLRFMCAHSVLTGIDPRAAGRSSRGPDR